MSALRTAVADRVGQARFELWFGAAARFELLDGRLLVGAPNRFFRDWLVSNFRGEIEAACLAVLGKCLPIDFCVDDSLPEPDCRPATAPTVAGNQSLAVKPSAPPGRVPANRESGPANGSGCGGNGSPRQRSIDLDSFVVGRTNRLARAAADLVVNRPGELSPLVVHGPTSVGKTHLLEGICHSARKARPGITAIYLTAEQFTTGFLQALRGGGLPNFRRKYRGVDLLAIDDVQFFSRTRCTKLELLYTIDTFLREKRQIVFAADRPVTELSDLGPDLCTRLQGGMVCPMQPPDYETRLGILGQMTKRFEMHVPHGVKQFIAARLTCHPRELSGALCRLHATSTAVGRPIDLAMAEEALADLIGAGSRVIRLPDIAKAVGDAFGLDPRSLQSGRKTKDVSHPRMLAMWLARKYTRAALSEIGQYFGRRSHSTVISAQKRVTSWLAAGTQVELAESVCGVEEAIREMEKRLLAG